MAGMDVPAMTGRGLAYLEPSDRGPIPVKPYYDEGGMTIYCGRAEDILPALGGIDLIFTSPPYNMGVTTGGGFGHGRGYMGDKWPRGGFTRDGADYDEHHDAMPPAQYEQWQKSILTDCWATLTDFGAIYYNHKPRIQASTLWLPTELNPGLPLRQIVIWARAGGINFAPTHYCPTHEWLLVFAKQDWRLKSKGASGIGDVWYVPQESSPHPAPFPIGLPARALESVAPHTVLDPFMGSGTTLRAAKDAGIRAIGIESSERWCEYAATRLAQESLFGKDSPSAEMRVSSADAGPSGGSRVPEGEVMPASNCVRA